LIIRHADACTQQDYADLGSDHPIFQSWDTALTAHENSDYSAVTTWARVSKEQYILLNICQFKVSSDQLVEKIASHTRAWQAKKVYIEEANHAVDLIRLVQSKLAGHAQVYSERHNNQSKMDRLEAVLFLINSGFIYLIEGDASAQLLLNQLRRFPHGRHDDCVDSFTQALKVMRKSSGRPYWRIS
jgi:predicted phage terminase large subunit-like protein